MIVISPWHNHVFVKELSRHISKRVIWASYNTSPGDFNSLQNSMRESYAQTIYAYQQGAMVEGNYHDFYHVIAPAILTEKEMTKLKFEYDRAVKTLPVISHLLLIEDSFYKAYEDNYKAYLNGLDQSETNLIRIPDAEPTQLLAETLTKLYRN